MGNHF